MGKKLTINTGRGPTVIVGSNRARVVAADNLAVNGVVHIIDKVLEVPPSPPTRPTRPPSSPPTRPTRPPSRPPTKPTIVDLAIATPDLSQLVEAVVKAELVDFLGGPGPYTVFAPTNDAFAKAFPDGLDGLTKEQVASVLKYHVVDGSIKAADLKRTQTVPTKEMGKDLGIIKLRSTVIVGSNRARVVAADNLAVNGVVHIIEKVLEVP